MTISIKLENDTACFHCGLPVPKGEAWGIEFEGQWKPMCCPGCEAVAQAIIDSGLSSFYLKRTAYSVTVDSLEDVLEPCMTELSEAEFEDDELQETSLIIEGITLFLLASTMQPDGRDSKRLSKRFLLLMS